MLNSRMWNGNAMQNLSMLKKLERGTCLDLSECRKTPSGDFILTDEQRATVLLKEVDLCVAVTESWVWSVGRCKQSGQVFASLDTRFYQHPSYDCLWHR